MPKDWSLRTRVKVAAVVALLGLLVWADAHFWAGPAECASPTTTATGTTQATADCADR